MSLWIIFIDECISIERLTKQSKLRKLLSLFVNQSESLQVLIIDNLSSIKRLPVLSKLHELWYLSISHFDLLQGLPNVPNSCLRVVRMLNVRRVLWLWYVLQMVSEIQPLPILKVDGYVYLKVALFPISDLLCCNYIYPLSFPFCIVSSQPINQLFISFSCSPLEMICTSCTLHNSSV